MAFEDARIRSLETARECLRLGARQRTISWLTGLPTHFIVHNIYDAQHLARRGRPPYAEDFIFRVPLRVQAEVAMVAAKYRLLTAERFTPATALITAFRHYLSVVRHPSFSFDEAFFVISSLDGIWAASGRTLELCACRRCGCLHVLPNGAAPAAAGCPFCRTRRVGHRSSAAEPVRGETVDRAANDEQVTIPAALEIQIRSMNFERSLRKLGVHPRLMATLTGVPSTSARRSSCCMRKGPPRIGHAINLVRWGVVVKTVQRARYSLVASVYTRLVAASFEPADAMRAAFLHVAPMFPSAAPLSFDRCFEIVSLLDTRWGAVAPALDLLDCPKCQASFLASLHDRDRPHCPFCALILAPQRYLDASPRGSGPLAIVARSDGISG